MMKDRLIGALFGICLGVSSSIAVSDAFTQQAHAIWSSIGALAVLVATGASCSRHAVHTHSRRRHERQNADRTAARALRQSPTGSTPRASGG